MLINTDIETLKHMHPIGTSVLARWVSRPETKSSGIHGTAIVLPEVASNTGTAKWLVLACGPGDKTKKGLKPIQIRRGDTVWTPQRFLTQKTSLELFRFVIDGEVYAFFRELSIVCYLRNPEAPPPYFAQQYVDELSAKNWSLCVSPECKVLQIGDKEWRSKCAFCNNESLIEIKEAAAWGWIDTKLCHTWPEKP